GTPAAPPRLHNRHAGRTGARVLRLQGPASPGPAGHVDHPAVPGPGAGPLGNVDTSFTASVTVAIGTNPVGGRLSGTTSVTPVNGVALFGDLSIDRAGTGYTLSATAPGATGATSASFDVSAATGSGPAR